MSTEGKTNQPQANIPGSPLSGEKKAQGSVPNTNQMLKSKTTSMMNTNNPPKKQPIVQTQPIVQNQPTTSTNMNITPSNVAPQTGGALSNKSKNKDNNMTWSHNLQKEENAPASQEAQQILNEGANTSNIQYQKLFKKIRNNQQLLDIEFDRLAKNFSLLIATDLVFERKRLEEIKNNNEELKIPELNGEGVNQKKIMYFYWNKILKIFAEKNSHLSINGIIELIKLHIKNNHEVYYKVGRFNIKKFKDQGSFVYSKDSPTGEDIIVNVNSENKLFQSIISSLEDIKSNFFAAFQKIFTTIRIQSQTNPATCNVLLKLNNSKFNKNDKILMNLWSSYMALVKNNQKFQTKQNQFEAISKSIVSYYKFNSKAFTEETCKHFIVFIKQNYRILNQYEKSLKIQCIDELILSIFLESPYTCSKWTKQIVEGLKQSNQNIFRCLYNLFLQNQNCRMRQNSRTKQKLKTKSAESNYAGLHAIGPYWLQYIQQILHISNVNNNRQRFKQQFLFESINSILEARAAQFWKDDIECEEIKDYIRFIGVEYFEKQQNQENNLKEVLQITRLMISSFGKKNSLGCYEFIDHCIKGFFNKFFNYNQQQLFLKHQIQIIDNSDRYLNQVSFQENLGSYTSIYYDLNILYDYFLKVLAYDPLFFKKCKYYNKNNPIQKCPILIEETLTVIYLFDNKENLKRQWMQLIFNAINSIIKEQKAEQISNRLLELLQSFHNEDDFDEMGDNGKKSLERNTWRVIEMLMDSSNQDGITQKQDIQFKQEILAKHMILLLKLDKGQPNNLWFSCLMKKFYYLSKQMHPHRMHLYAEIYNQILLLELADFDRKTIEIASNAKKSALQMRCNNENLYERFGLNLDFCLNFIRWCLNICFDKNETPRSKLIETRQFTKLMRAIQLLKTLCLCYLKQKQSSSLKLIPEIIKRQLGLPNKEGKYQLQIENNRATSFISALAIILLTRNKDIQKQFNKLYPNHELEIYQTLTLLVEIQVEVKNDSLFKIYTLSSSFGDSFKEFRSVEGQFISYIKNNPTPAGLRFLCCGQYHSLEGLSASEERRKVVEKLLELKNLNKYTNNNLHKIEIPTLQAVSIYLKLFLKEKSFIIKKNDPKERQKLWLQLKTSMDIIAQNIYNKRRQIDPNSDKLQYQDLLKIIENIYEMVLDVQVLSQDFYTMFVMRYHQLFFHEINIIKTFHQKEISVESEQQQFINDPFIQSQMIISLVPNYNDMLTNFFHSKTYLSTANYKLICSLKNLPTLILSLIRKILESIEVKQYQAQICDMFIFQLISNAINMYIDVYHQQNKSLQEEAKFRDQLVAIKQLILNRTYRDKFMLSHHQMISLLVINCALGENFSEKEINFQNNYWILQLNATDASLQIANKLIKNIAITDNHPIIFISSCNYLRKYVGSGSFKCNTIFIKYLNDILLEVIVKEESYFIVMVIEIFIEMMSNEQMRKDQMSYHVEQVKKIVFQNRNCLDRFYQLVTKLQHHYSKEQFNQTHAFQSNQSHTLKNSCGDSMAIAQKIQFLAYLRVFSFIFHYSEQSINSMQSQFQERILELIPLMQDLISNKTLTSPMSNMESKMSRTSLGDLLNLMPNLSEQVQTSGIKNYTMESFKHSFGNIKNSLDFFHQFINLKIVTTYSMILSTIINESCEMEDSNYENVLYLFNTLLKKVNAILENKGTFEHLFRSIHTTIYSGSLDLAEQMRFTNQRQLSSYLHFDIEIFLQELCDTLCIIFQICKCGLDDKHRKLSKNQQKFKKIFHINQKFIIENAKLKDFSRLQEKITKDKKSRSQYETMRISGRSTVIRNF